LGIPPPDHEQPGGGGFDLGAGELSEVPHRVDAHVAVFVLALVLDQAETGAGIREGGAEDRDLVGRSRGDQAALTPPLFEEVAAHLPDESPGGIDAGFQGVGDLLDRPVAALQLLLVDVRVVHAVDAEWRAITPAIPGGRRSVVLRWPPWSGPFARS
jgi:hypothetical protein